MQNQKLLKGDIEPWRCTNCKQLMYNVDADGLPVPGAPDSRWWSIEHNQVCQFCYEVASAVLEKSEE